MKRITTVFFMIILAAANLFGAEPVFPVPDLPSREKMEFYEESEELFISKLLEYYNIATALRTQLLYLGAEPKTKMPDPTFENMSDQDMQIIVRYYRYAKAFEDELSKLPDSFSKQQIDSLRIALVSCQRNYDSLSLDTKDIQNANKFEKLFKDNLDACMKENARKNHIIDSLKFNALERLEKQRENLSVYYEEFYKSTLPVLSASVAANKLFINSSKVESKLSVSAEILLNCNPIFKYGKYFDIWANYLMPVINTKSNNPQNTASKLIHTWKADVFSAGVNINVPKILEFSDLHVGFKLGVGQFWGVGKMYNVNSQNLDYYGQNLRFELNFGFASYYAPYEIYFAYSSNFHTNDFIFDTPTETIDLGSPVNNMITLGFRLPLIRFYNSAN